MRLGAYDDPGHQPPHRFDQFRRFRKIAVLSGEGDQSFDIGAVLLDRASSFVLGLAGIQPATSAGLAVNIEIKAGYVIDLTDDPRPGADGGMRIVSPTVYAPPAIDADLEQDSAE